MDQAVADPPSPTEPTQPKKRQKRVNLALAGVLLAQGLSYEEIAPRVGAKNSNSLRVNLYKKGINMKVTRNPSPEHLATSSITAKLVSEASGQIQDMLNEEIAAQIKSVRSVPVRYADLANDNQGRAAMVKQIAESFRAVNGNPDSITFSFGASAQSLEPAIEQPAIDVPEVAQQVAQEPPTG